MSLGIHFRLSDNHVILLKFVCLRNGICPFSNKLDPHAVFFIECFWFFLEYISGNLEYRDMPERLRSSAQPQTVHLLFSFKIVVLLKARLNCNQRSKAHLK